ncbi:peptidyl-lys metalloendopeptidase [Moniliophthora roreri MCA 2997]|uniref:Peptidyl-lys metalloendopeptidase n=1 Tax=Moniliophthora roreri (strain MCA 2997) TaxID=1381753 RepID=V2XAE9_MONRO|nr:peptidyl-lys metalloendopeptidase [Moniliophthora roreri MCA 2997]
MKLTRLLSAVSLATSTHATPFQRTDGLTIKVNGPNSISGSSIADLKLTVDVTNNGAEPVRVLRYNNVLDILPTRSWRVGKNGSEVGFIGIKVALQIDENAYITINNGDTVSVVHEGSLFGFASAGAGTFSFEPIAPEPQVTVLPTSKGSRRNQTPSFDVAITGEIPHLESLTPREPISICTDPVKKAFMDASYPEAMALAQLSYDYITANGASDDLYQAYFSTNDPARILRNLRYVIEEDTGGPTIT